MTNCVRKEPKMKNMKLWLIIVAVIGAGFTTVAVVNKKAVAETKTIHVDITPGTSEANNVGCGYMLIEKSSTILKIVLGPSDIIESKLVSWAPGTYWEQDGSPDKWKCTGVAPNKEFWCVIKARFAGEGGGWVWMSVSDVDLDGDTDNDNYSTHRPPSKSDSEDLKEYPTTTDNIVGLLVPLNNDNDVSWDSRDDNKSMDYDKDDDVLDLELKINAKKAGKTNYSTVAANIWCYDDAGKADGDEGFNHSVKAGKYEKSLHIEAQCSATSGTLGHIITYFHPNEPRGALPAYDKVRCLIIATDIDVDTDNNGSIASNNWAEDFYENHPASELTDHPEYKFGMIVGINDDDDDMNGKADNGWNGTNWNGSDGATIQGAADKAKMKPAKLRKLNLTLTQEQKLALESQGATIMVTKVGGTGAVRLFREDGALIGAFINYDAYAYAGSDDLWELLYGTTNDCDLLVEGLRGGEVELEVEIVLATTGVTVHKDRVRISVMGFNLDVNNNNSLNDAVDGIAGYLPGYEGTTRKITYSTTGASVVYSAGQTMKLIATCPSQITTVDFSITSCSDEPGFCMNSSDSPNTDDDDYSFAATSEDRSVKSVSTSGGKASQPFYCKDFGGYCVVRAVFKSGDTTVLTLERKIPQDDNSNHVADGHSSNTGPGTSSAANDDNDNSPAGDGADGDNLSRYQEFRGFVCEGNHIRTDPSRKDVFVYNKDSLDASDFTTQNLTAPVHYVRMNEMPENRDINSKQETAHITYYSAIMIVEYMLHDDDWPCFGVLNYTTPTQPQNSTPNVVSCCYVFSNVINAQATTLTADINATTNTIPIYTGIEWWMPTGYIRIDDEVIAYTGVTENSFTGCTRGAAGTIAVAHNNNAPIPKFAFPDDFAKKVFAHELGHACNLVHPNPPTETIMDVELYRWGSVAGNGYWHVFGSDIPGHFRVSD